ncbi:hypothetical protein [Nitrolancea hollandica]|uniref:hypothetical protein n=1 Tax=Nitrolancea hollandica TaxID=1206749 RepID=UPI0003123244|nr:hypothetical protein [Nitrolancea hollandica]
MLDEEPRESRNLVTLYAERLQLRQLRRAGLESRPRPRRAKTVVVREFGRQAARSRRSPEAAPTASWLPPGDGGDHASSPA